MHIKSLLIMVLVVCVVLIAGCTSSGSNVQVEQMNGVPSEVPTPSSTTISTPTPTMMATQPIPETQIPETTVTPTVTEEVILDEGVVVYPGTYKIFKFEELLPDGGFLYPDDSFKVEISSENPVNILFFRDINMEYFDSNSITWDPSNYEWKYDARLDPVVKFDQVTRKKFDITINKLGKYSLCIDGRVSENDLTVANDAIELDVKVIKLEK